MFSILIPTFNNHEYLKFCIRSLKNNSNFNNQIICHVNVGEDETINFLKQNNIDYTHTSYNAGICEGINNAAKLAKFDYLILKILPPLKLLCWNVVITGSHKKND